MIVDSPDAIEDRHRTRAQRLYGFFSSNTVCCFDAEADIAAGFDVARTDVRGRLPESGSR
jgi:hypothetical protein